MVLLKLCGVQQHVFKAFTLNKKNLRSWKSPLASKPLLKNVCVRVRCSFVGKLFPLGVNKRWKLSKLPMENDLHEVKGSKKKMGIYILDMHGNMFSMVFIFFTIWNALTLIWPHAKNFFCTLNSTFFILGRTISFGIFSIKIRTKILFPFEKWISNLK